MKTFSNNSLFTLVAVTMLASCARPYARFQKTTPEHFTTETTTARAETPVVVTDPVVTQSTKGVVAEESVATAIDKADAELQKADVLVSTKAGLATNKKVSSHLTRVKNMIAEVRAKAATTASGVGATTTSVAPQKMSLIKRLVAKSIDKKIQKKMAPKKTMARGLLSIGLIIALIGLLLLLIGTGTVYSLGYVGLVVGIILIIASLI